MGTLLHHPVCFFDLLPRESDTCNRCRFDLGPLRRPWVNRAGLWGYQALRVGFLRGSIQATSMRDAPKSLRSLLLVHQLWIIFLVPGDSVAERGMGLSSCIWRPGYIDAVGHADFLAGPQALHPYSPVARNKIRGFHESDLVRALKPWRPEA